MREIESLADVLAVKPEFEIAFRDGLNRIRHLIRQKQALAQDDRESKIKLVADKLQSMIEERDNLTLELKAEEEELQKLLAEFNENSAPLKAKTSEYEELYEAQAQDLQELKNDASVCIANRDRYLAEVEALRADFDAAITAGDQTAAATALSKGKLAEANVVAEGRRGTSISVKLKNKENEMLGTMRKASPFVTQLNTLHKSWQANWLSHEAICQEA